MTAITVVGGVYHERCIWPDWDNLYGSGGRAAAALSGHVDQIRLRAYARPDTSVDFAPYAAMYGFTFDPVEADQTISFEYVHSLSTPVIRPAYGRIRQNPQINVSDDLVLRFGLLEGSAVVTADRCVYDPQSAFDPEPFGTNGSSASHLAIVANRGEVLAMSRTTDPIDGARALLSAGAEVVVIKSGPGGAFVVDGNDVVHVSAYQTKSVWTIGSGDVFAAIFAARWGAHRDSPLAAAELASKAVAAYVESMALPAPTLEMLRLDQRPEAKTMPGRVYLASPFFTIGERWLVDEAREGLRQLGLEVFSPVHDVGRGPAETVAPADLAALNECDRVLAILDGIDSGTVFEVGYARARSIPVYALAQAVPPEDLKMVIGSDCRVFDDFVTALHHTAWRT
jgi:nucleoside 2-deoxyribosyltransferase